MHTTHTKCFGRDHVMVMVGPNHPTASFTKQFSFLVRRTAWNPNLRWCFVVRVSWLVRRSQAPCAKQDGASVTMRRRGKNKEINKSKEKGKPWRTLGQSQPATPGPSSTSKHREGSDSVRKGQVGRRQKAMEQRQNVTLRMCSDSASLSNIGGGGSFCQPATRCVS